ncbi:MAG: nucleotidyltransferase domain-containing protein [Ignavibacteriales bacterium]|nr:nucleotidyltransferase domain-containing protein [Ignavibacteriales bacterium]
MYTQETLKNLLERFIALVSDEIHIKSLYLFGSYAQGTQQKYSDVDVAIVQTIFREFDIMTTDVYASS